MFYKKSLIILFIVLSVSIFHFNSVSADCSGQSSSGDTVELCNPLGDNEPTIPELIGRVIKAALGIVGSLALVMFIYGGITWMTAAGNSEQVTKGKGIIVWAAIGLVVIFASYALVHFVIQTAILGVVTE